MASDPEIMNNYYNLLELTLSENDLLDKPAQIFNIDETGMPLDPSPPSEKQRKKEEREGAKASEGTDGEGEKVLRERT